MRWVLALSAVAVVLAATPAPAENGIERLLDMQAAIRAARDRIRGRVVRIGRAIDNDTDEETNISGIPLGATVLIGRHAGVKVPWEESLRVVETKEVLAIVDEVELV